MSLMNTARITGLAAVLAGGELKASTDSHASLEPLVSSIVTKDPFHLIQLPKLSVVVSNSTSVVAEHKSQKRSVWKVVCGFASSLCSIAGATAMIKHIRSGNLKDKTLASFLPWTANSVISLASALTLKDPYIVIPTIGVTAAAVSYFAVACKHLKWGAMTTAEKAFMGAASFAAGLFCISRLPNASETISSIFNCNISAGLLNELSFSFSAAAALIGSVPTIIRMFKAEPKGELTSSLLFHSAPWAGFMLGRVFGLFSVDKLSFSNTLFSSSFALLVMNTALTLGAVRFWTLDSKAKKQKTDDLV